jgi:hypothetical protein
MKISTYFNLKKRIVSSKTILEFTAQMWWLMRLAQPKNFDSDAPSHIVNFVGIACL